ncbi:hypothetical protein ARALYDRAFT_905795 [Arabidopsis lyrata subsp. lyrata]|uniref:Protein kinase domain-containing protein n=2 Tax=Arabidopsis lyrata subsp. lyrata TaxID=81972 RepID=D7LMW0_ARALL|nr:hypothetical protein ARALYDRAFT_905795 [Arabidopsis lyrata subsp. lyrata]
MKGRLLTIFLCFTIKMFYRESEMDSRISMSAYYRRYGQRKLNDLSNPPLKKPKYSPTKNGIVISDSSSNTMTSPLPQTPTLAVKQSPTILHRQRCSKNKRKRSSTPPPLEKSTSSSKEISEGSSTKGGLVKKSSCWVKSRLLGKGAYGSVYLATYKNEERAIKTAEISRSLSLIDEGRILRGLQSPYVISYFGDEMVREGNGHRYNLILEYCSGQSLGDLIRNNHGGLMEFDVKLFARDVLCGLIHIHEKNIIHCDIKPDNLLLSPLDHRYRSNGYIAKIGDFGLALEKGSVEYRNGSGHKRGTRRYMAPELISHGIVDFNVDTWSFGCSVLEMLTGKQVWGEYGHLTKEDWINLIGHTDLIPHIPSGLPAEAQDFLRKCLVKDPDSRWGVRELVSHPYLSYD